MNLKEHFQPFREGIIGINKTFVTPFGEKKIVYLDWTASGRLYAGIEEIMLHTFGPLVANTHTQSNYTGSTMTASFHQAIQIIKKHVHADSSDVLLFEGTGMTGAVCKFQRLLNLKKYPSKEKPVVFVTHMEHHSNQISWLESNCEVIIIPPNESGYTSENELIKALEAHKHNPLKIGAFTACSNVTGRKTDYHRLAKIMHEYNGICFVDFSASAPYEKIDMHPSSPEERLDAISFSPHKFLGGPGTSGVLIFDSSLYHNKTPDRPGGGTVLWTNPWGGVRYYDDIETRENGGTPGFLQAIRIALAITLKEKMGIENIKARKLMLSNYLNQKLKKMKGVSLLDFNHENDSGIFSFYMEGISHDLVVKLLNDRYGIQVRGGCLCAGTYGHYLLKIEKEMSKMITDEIDKGNFQLKPGWVRASLHPTTTIDEIDLLCQALTDIVDNKDVYRHDYHYLEEKNTYVHKDEKDCEDMTEWFNL